MPAIDPVKLEREITWLLKGVEDPASLRRRLLRLLDTYADRKLHAGDAGVEKGVPWSVNVPEPLMRQLGRALQKRTAAKPGLVWSVAEELFSAGYQETQRLAIAVIAPMESQQVAAWAETNVQRALDAVVVSEIAGIGFAGWRRTAPQAFLERVTSWLGSDDKRLRLMALMALTSAVSDPAFEDMPTVFGMLRGMSEMALGEARQALTQLVRALARRSAPETARFLLDELDLDGESIHGVVQHTLDSFPRSLQARLRLGLAGKRSVV